MATYPNGFWFHSNPYVFSTGISHSTRTAVTSAPSVPGFLHGVTTHQLGRPLSWLCVDAKKSAFPSQPPGGNDRRRLPVKRGPTSQMSTGRVPRVYTSQLHQSFPGETRMDKMSAPQKQSLDTLFAITTSRLVILPTPIAISLKSYRKLYAELHADASFCEMGFGSHFPVKNWSDDETYEVIATRDIARSWEKYALGDFAVGLRVPGESQQDLPQIFILQGQEFEELAGEERENLSRIEWIGYAGVRDALTTSLPPREPDDPPLPPWQEMVELRYGISPRFWGRGMANEAAEAVKQWSVQRRGVRRFIAETERENVRSAWVLQKLEFVVSTTQYWKEPSEQEWELVVDH